MSTFSIKDYIIDRKRIGKGSFSTIYKGYNLKNNRQYAIKEIIVDKKNIKSNVKREFLVLKKLNHPNIVKLHDLIVDTNYNNIYFTSPQWNPNIELQAIARCHRIGQRNTVNIHYYIYNFKIKQSIEKHILRVQNNKLKRINSFIIK